MYGGIGEGQIQDLQINPEIDPHKCSQLNFNKGKRQFNGGRIVFSTNSIGAVGYVHNPEKKAST